jgi:hypothetical protein
MRDVQKVARIHLLADRLTRCGQFKIDIEQMALPLFIGMLVSRMETDGLFYVH